MNNIGVVCDTLWDNYILVNNKFKKINSEHFRIHVLYGKTLEIFNNCASSNNLCILRHYSDNLCKTIYNLLKICDLWLIFTNHIEYNTQTRLIIEKCEEYNIKYIIVSEYSRNEDYYSYEYDKNLSFKKNLYNITKYKNEDILKFDYKEYNYNYNKTFFVPINISNEIRTKLKESYLSINQYKKERSIKLLYDKDEFKHEKQLKKAIKESNHLNFSKNRINYYKNLK